MNTNIIIFILLLIIILFIVFNFTKYNEKTLNVNPMLTQPTNYYNNASNANPIYLYPDDYNYERQPYYWYNPYWLNLWGGRGGGYNSYTHGVHGGGGHFRGGGGHFRGGGGHFRGGGGHRGH